MKHKLAFSSLLLLALFLAVVPTAVASTTWYVDGVHGSDNNNCKSPQTACKTIGHAISLASSGDSIMVAAATYTENVTVSFSLRIVGSGAKTTIIDGGGVNTVVTISNASANVTLSKITIRDGTGEFGGGVNNSGRLTISNSTISGNSSTGVFLCHGGGAGINNDGTLTINSTTISGNTIALYNRSYYACGGGVFNGGSLIINNSTISGNSVQETFSPAGAFGGGIYNSGLLTINNGTVSGNSATNVFNGNGAGGGIYSSSSTATLQNSIVADNTSDYGSGNCYGTMTSNGYNLSSDNSCNFNGTGDLNNTDPKLGQLGNYGGPTQTIPLLSGSPAIDAGNPNGCTDSKGHLLKTDQRGKPRHDKEDTSGCDMGAFERQKD